MSAQIVAPDGIRQNPATSDNTPEPTRALLLKYRLGYAKKGIRTSPADVAKKKPHLTGWQKQATTNRQRIITESNRWPDAGILTPTGQRDGRWVLDVDDFEDLERLEKKLGVRLRGISTEVRTQRGRLHIHFRWPEGGEDIRNSVGKMVQDGFEGLDVRGEGGLAPLPPSSGYRFANDLRMKPAPAKLVGFASSRTRSRGRDAGGARERIEIPDGELVEEGNRNDTIFWGCYDKHQAGERPEDIEAWALAFNDKRCHPGETHPHTEAEVLRTVRSACSYPIRHREPDPDARRTAEDAWRSWWEDLVPRGGRSKLRDSARVLLENALEHPNVVEVITEDGEIRKALVSSISCRQGGPKAGTSHMSFARAMRKLEDAGKILRGTDKRREDHSEMWLILDPATNCYTPGTSSLGGENAGGVTPCRGPEKTPTFRWRHPVGNAGGGVLAVAEVFGFQTREELAERVGYTRARDLEKRHLERLIERGDLVEQDGYYGCPKDYGERMEAERNEAYSGWKRRRTTVDPGNGCEIRWVEYGPEMSDVERDARDQEIYKEQQRKFREELEKRKTRSYQDPGNSPEELLEVAKNLLPGADGYVSELEHVEPEPEVEAPEAPIPDQCAVFSLARDLEEIEADVLSEPDYALADALAEYLGRHPHRRGETPSWLAVTLWAYELVETKPTPEAVGDALALLEMPA